MGEWMPLAVKTTVSKCNKLTINIVLCLPLVFSCVEAIVNQIVFVAGDFDAVAMACRFSRAIPDSWLGGMPIGLRGRDFWTAWKDEPFWTGFSLREAKWIKIESEIAGF